MRVLTRLVAHHHSSWAKKAPRCRNGFGKRSRRNLRTYSPESWRTSRSLRHGITCCCRASMQGKLGFVVKSKSASEQLSLRSFLRTDDILICLSPSHRRASRIFRCFRCTDFAFSSVGTPPWLQLPEPMIHCVHLSRVFRWRL